MATVLPPPSKRQKLAADIERKEQVERDRIPDDLGNVRVQFVDQATGKVTGAPVSIPIAQANVKNLELLLNSLQGQVSMSTSAYCPNVQRTNRDAGCGLLR